MKFTFQGEKIEVEEEQLEVGSHMPEFQVETGGVLSARISCDDKEGLRVFISLPSTDDITESVELETFMQQVNKYPNVTCYAVTSQMLLSMWGYEDRAIHQLKICWEDEEHSFSKATGTYATSMELLVPAIFVVDKDNVIQYAMYAYEILDDPNYEEAIAKIRELV